jgi:hypothetical protein
MFTTSIYYDTDPQKHFDYHKDMLKKAEHARLVREAMQAKESNPGSSRGLDWLWQLHLRIRNQVPFAKRTLHVHSQVPVKMD